MKHQGLDHVVNCVPSTEDGLTIRRDKLGFPVVCSEIVNGAIRITRLDLGNTHLQLVEPLTPDRPLRGGLAGDAAPRQGMQGPRTRFLAKVAGQPRSVLALTPFPSAEIFPHENHPTPPRRAAHGPRAALCSRRRASCRRA